MHPKAYPCVYQIKSTPTHISLLFQQYLFFSFQCRELFTYNKQYVGNKRKQDQDTGSHRRPLWIISSTDPCSASLCRLTYPLLINVTVFQHTSLVLSCGRMNIYLSVCSFNKVLFSLSTFSSFWPSHVFLHPQCHIGLLVHNRFDWLLSKRSLYYCSHDLCEKG